MLFQYASAEVGSLKRKSITFEFTEYKAEERPLRAATRDHDFICGKCCNEAS